MFNTIVDFFLNTPPEELIPYFGVIGLLVLVILFQNSRTSSKEMNNKILEAEIRDEIRKNKS